MGNRIKKIVFILFMISFVSIKAFAYTEEAITTYDKGVELSKRGYIKEALEQFNKAISIEADFIDAYYNAGAIYEYLNETDNAIKLFEVLLTKTPDDDDVRVKLANLYYKKANYSKSLNVLSKITPDSVSYTECKQIREKSQNKLNEIKKKEQAQRLISSKVVVPGFNGPTGITKDSKGNLYIANFLSNSITKITASGQKTIIKRPEFISGPIGLVADKEDNIYIANYNSNKVVKITNDGRFENLISPIKKPYYLFVDNSGYLYITEQGTNTLIKVKITD